MSPTSTPGSRPRSRLLPAPPSERGSGSARAAVQRATRCPRTGPPTSPGPTWTRTTDPDGTPGEWYLHLFSADQPDLNWDHPDVRREHEAILRFWFDRGVAGIRIDSAALLVKDPSLPEVPAEPAAGEHPNTDRDELHDIYRSWRAIADGYPGSRILVGEMWLPDVERFAKYLRPDELHTAFNFDFLAQPWDAVGAARVDRRDARGARPGRRAGDLGALQPRRHPAGDPLRPGGLVVRLRRASGAGTPTDLELGRRRARAAALLAAALPGSLYIYQGDELGLDEVQDLPAAPARGPDALPLGWRGPRPRRVPGPAALVGRRPRRSGSARRSDAAEPWLRQPATWAH